MPKTHKARTAGLVVAAVRASTNQRGRRQLIYVSASLSQTYGYDPLARLTSVTATGANQTFVWDANGNRTSHAWGGATDG